MIFKMKLDIKVLKLFQNPQDQVVSNVLELFERDYILLDGGDEFILYKFMIING